MTPRRRLIMVIMIGAVCMTVLGTGSADAQRVVQRAPVPATQGRYAVPRPSISARPPYAGRSYYRAPVYPPYYYGRPSYLYGGFYSGYLYGGFYSGYGPYPYSFSVGIEPGYPYYRQPHYPYYPYYQPYPRYPFYRSYPYYPKYNGPDGHAYGSLTSLQLRVIPWNAEVFIDGFYAGTVDDFDGPYEELQIEPGNHTVEVFHPAHRTLTRKIYLQPGKTFTLGATLEPLAPGEREPVRPGASTPEPQ